MSYQFEEIFFFVSFLMKGNQFAWKAFPDRLYNQCFSVWRSMQISASPIALVGEVEAKGDGPRDSKIEVFHFLN